MPKSITPSTSVMILNIPNLPENTFVFNAMLTYESEVSPVYFGLFFDSRGLDPVQSNLRLPSPDAQ
jgi:hypothetical protein